MAPPSFLAKSDDPSQQTSYGGNCHCKAVKYTVVLPRPVDSNPCQITQCNCSICSKNGYLLVHGLMSSLKIEQGEESLTTYKFGNKNAIHRFCKTCGSSVYVVAPAKLFGGDGEDVFGLNIRTMRDVNFESLETRKADGWSKGFSPPYEC